MSHSHTLNACFIEKHFCMSLHRDPLTVNDMSLGGTNASCLGDFGGPVMPWVALGGYTGQSCNPCLSILSVSTFSIGYLVYGTVLVVIVGTSCSNSAKCSYYY